MNSVHHHYATHLAPIYVWMAGGIEHAVTLGAQDIADFLKSTGYAADLGAGFGMHTIPLAKAGWDVLAVDTSELLLAELRKQCTGLPVATAVADLLSFADHLTDKVDLVLCMGDTLTHLEHSDQITELMASVGAALRPGGQFIATFRDYQTLPCGDNRFIPVRSDSERILTCFLEEQPEHVVVHDILHERRNDRWAMSISSYRKLRLSPAVVIEAAKAAGLHGNVEPGPRGMLQIRASA